MVQIFCTSALIIIFSLTYAKKGKKPSCWPIFHIYCKRGPIHHPQSLSQAYMVLPIHAMRWYLVHIFNSNPCPKGVCSALQPVICIWVVLPTVVTPSTPVPTTPGNSTGETTAAPEVGTTANASASTVTPLPSTPSINGSSGDLALDTAVPCDCLLCNPCCSCISFLFMILVLKMRLKVSIVDLYVLLNAKRPIYMFLRACILSKRQRSMSYK